MGSRLGWMLALIFAAFVITAIVVVVLFPSPTPPTRATTAAGMLTCQQPRKPISLVIGTTPEGKGDAGDDYWNALQLYDANAPALKEIARHYTQIARGEYRLRASEVDLLRQVAEPIAAGAGRGRMSYYFRLTPKKMGMPYYPAEAGKFQNLAGVPQLLAAHYAASGQESYPQAEKCLFDMLVLGWHLMGERARMDLVGTGVGLQQAACELLAGLYGKWNRPERLEAVRQYKDGLWDLGSIYSDLREVIWQSTHQQGAAPGPHPGDIFNLAENHADRAVRAEATLALGVVKLTVTTRGDRRYVKKLIAAKLGSEDAIERVAAECADALDAPGLQRLANLPPGGE